MSFLLIHGRHGAKLKIMVSVPGITQAKNLPVDFQSLPSFCASSL